MKRYYSMVQNGTEADIYIFGDIVDPLTKEIDYVFYGIESEVSGFSLVQDLQGIDADIINVYINSYGGDVSEGLAIHNVLKNHKARIRTVCTGFACSAASVVFMAGDERLMYPASLLMIHNAWVKVSGNAADLRKQADDLETITQATISTYMAVVNITEEEVKQLLDAETWISPQDALAKGFATGIINESASNKASASARGALFARIFNKKEPTVNISITDMPEFKQAMKELHEGFESLKASAQPAEPPQKNEPINFLNALMGGKD